MNYMKKILLITILLITSISFAYTDIADDYWAKDIIERFSNNEIIKGYPDGTFRPEDTLTRAEFITMLVKITKMESNEGNKPYHIDDNHWAKEVIDIAQANGVIEEGDYSTFNPDVAIRRYEICRMIANSFSNIKDSYKNNSYRSSFSDIKDESKEINSILAILQELDLLNGYSDNTARINNTCERAEAVAFLNNILENKNKIESYKGIEDNVIYYDGDKIVGKSDLPSRLIKWENLRQEDSPIITTIDAIDFFKYEERGEKYKEMFDLISQHTDNPYCKSKQSKLNGRCIMTVDIHIDNTSQYAVDVSGRYLNIDFLNEEIEVINSFMEEDVVRALKEKAGCEEVMGEEERNFTIFYILDSIPTDLIKFNRKDSTLTDYENKTFVHINYDSSLVVELKR